MGLSATKWNCVRSFLTIPAWPAWSFAGLMVLASGCSSDQVTPAPGSAVEDAGRAEPPSQGTRPRVAPEAIREAGRATLRDILEFVPTGMEQAYGFRGPDELGKATVGDPLPVYTISPFPRNGHGPDWLPPLEFIDTWRVPVLVEGEPRCLATVAFAGSAWKTVDVGAAVLSRELDSLDRQLPDELRGRRRAWLRVFQLTADFLLLMPQDDGFDRAMVVPLRSASSSLGLAEGTAISPGELTQALGRGFAAWRDRGGAP